MNEYEKGNCPPEPVMATGASTCTPPREPKFRVLLESANGIQGVVDHLHDLCRTLGVTYEQSERKCEPKNSSEISLVRVLDELPQELAYSQSVAHDMINQIMNELN